MKPMWLAGVLAGTVLSTLVAAPASAGAPPTDWSNAGIVTRREAHKEVTATGKPLDLRWNAVLPAMTLDDPTTVYVTSDAGPVNIGGQVVRVESLPVYEYAVAVFNYTGKACEQVETSVSRNNAPGQGITWCLRTPWQKTTSSHVTMQYTATDDDAYYLITKPGTGWTITMQDVTYLVRGTHAAPSALTAPVLRTLNEWEPVLNAGDNMQIYLSASSAPGSIFPSHPYWEFPDKTRQSSTQPWTSLTYQYRPDGTGTWTTITPDSAEFGTAFTVTPPVSGSYRVIATADTDSGVTYTATSNEFHFKVRSKVGAPYGDIMTVSRSSARIGTPMTFEGYTFQRWSDGTSYTAREADAVLQYQAKGTSTWADVARSRSDANGDIRFTVPQRATGIWRLQGGREFWVTTRTTPDLDIVKVYYDQPGADSPVTNTKLNREYVLLRNNTSTKMYLSGWILRTKTGSTYTFPRGAYLAAGKSVTVHTGRGKYTATHNYWGRTQYAWHNTRDTATLRNPNGITLDTCTWSSTSPGYKNC